MEDLPTGCQAAIPEEGGQVALALLESSVEECLARVTGMIESLRGEALVRAVEWALSLTGDRPACRDAAGEIVLGEDPLRCVKVFDGDPLTKEDVRQAAREHPTGSQVTLVSNKPIDQSVVLNAYIHVCVQINTLGPDQLARAIVAGVALGD